MFCTNNVWYNIKAKIPAINPALNFGADNPSKIWQTSSFLNGLMNPIPAAFNTKFTGVVNQTDPDLPTDGFPGPFAVGDTQLMHLSGMPHTF